MTGSILLLRKSSFSLPHYFSGFALLLPLIVIGVLEKPSIAEVKNPASQDDVFLYRGIGGTFICNSLSAGIDFPKAAGIASATYVQVLEGKHGGVVSSVGDEKLSREKLFIGAEFQVVTAAMQFCSDKVPDEVKEKVKNALSKASTDNKNSKKNKKKR